ncbi:MAG: glucans biosynthesis glucosyltransferase MdoH [Pseudomonadota bacterium]
MTSNPIHPLAGDALMPPERPIRAEPVDFTAPVDGGGNACQAIDQKVFFLRVIVFGAGALAALSLGVGHLAWLGADGLSATDILLATLVSATLFWSVLTLVTAVLGLEGLRETQVKLPMKRVPEPDRSGPVSSQSVALLVPIRNEPVASVEERLAAMLADLDSAAQTRQFYLFVLSDSDQLSTLAEEAAMVARLCGGFGAGTVGACYRHRAKQTDFKAGNIRDWVARWGGAYDIMVPLDADSLMSAEAITVLCDTLLDYPSIAIAQSWPQIAGAQTVSARAEAFGSFVYGSLLACGYARWAGATANYWGHNAAIRVSAFASDGIAPSGFLSHDSVEAFALRRAGWGTMLIPERLESYEEAPSDLAGFLDRDARWCLGNLQHARLLGVSGAPLLARFNLLHGLVSYLAAPVWLAIFAAWLTLGSGEVSSVFHSIGGLVLLAGVYLCLLAPKLMGVGLALADPKLRSALGGARSVVLGGLFDVFHSLAYAPIWMVQRSGMVVASLVHFMRQGSGRPPIWRSQRASSHGLGWQALARRHGLETLLGFALVAGMVTGDISLWALPVAFSWSLAVPLAWLSAVSLSKNPDWQWLWQVPQPALGEKVRPTSVCEDGSSLAA